MKEDEIIETCSVCGTVLTNKGHLEYISVDKRILLKYVGLMHVA
jgi:hypothetical protein